MTSLITMKPQLLLLGFILFLILSGIASQLISGMGFIGYYDPIVALMIALGLTPLITDMFE